jgi:hypothetical protein
MDARGRALACIVVATLVVAGLSASASAQSSSTVPKATDIGVTATAIHIATVADVDNPFVPGLFQPVVDGVKGAVKYLNSKSGGGGIGGRKLVVDFSDSMLNPNAARDGIIAACQSAFALVGTSAALLTNVDDSINCKDQAGAVTGLPDIAAFATGMAEACSPVGFPVTPPQLDCKTKDQVPQTYIYGGGDTKYLVAHHKGGLHGAMILNNDSKDAERVDAVGADVAIHQGVKQDQRVSVSGRAPQSTFTPIINQMKNDGSNYAYSLTAVDNAVELRSEAQLQGLTDPNIVWTCLSSCYNKVLLQHADTMEGEYIPLQFLPFEEASANPMLANMLKYVGKDKVTGYTVYGWAAAIAFAQAARAVVAKDGVNGLTRRSLLKTGMPTLTKFDAEGMVATVNIADKVPSACFMLDRFVNSKFTRVYPAKKGTFDCTPSNRVAIKEDLLTP